jgi:putative MATE family efflux protein
VSERQSPPELDAPSDPEVETGALPAGTVAVAAGAPTRDELRRRTDRDIVRLAWPAIISQVLASAVSLIDIAMLGRLGTDALAAVGYTSQFFQLAQAALLALSVACVALMARALGAGDPERARGAFAASLVLALASAVAICVVSVGFPRQLLGMLNADPGVIDRAVPYFRLTLGSTLFLAVALTVESAFRSARNTTTPLLIAGVITAVKLALNFLLIFGTFGFPKLDLVGAGLATLGSQLVGVVLFVWVSQRRDRPESQAVRLRRADFAHVREFLPETARVSWPALGERVLLNSALLIYFWVLSDYGPVAIAAYTIGVRLLSFSWIPGVGISIAASTLVGQALGAGDARLAARAGWRAARLSLIVSLALFVVFALLRKTLAEGFTDDAEVIAALEPFMLLLGIAQPFLGVHFTLAGALRGAGDTVTPLWSATLGNWIFRVPLALLVAKVFHADVVWVWGTVVFDHVTRAIWLTWAFKRERWAKNLGAALGRGP